MSNIDCRKKVKVEEFQKALSAFVINSQTLLDEANKASTIKKGGLIDYYLINSNKFSKEELEDAIKFCRANEYLVDAIFKNFRNETISVDDALNSAHADIIFSYKFHDKKFRNWQLHVFEILTFKDLTDTL